MPGYELIGKEEFQEVQEVFDNGGVLFRHGFDSLRNDCYKVREFERAFALQMGVSRALAVTSGTAALRVALAALNLGPGDEVITQSFTFVATVEAIIESGATPVCVNIDKTLNLDPVELKKTITPKTKAVIVVHMLGTPAKLPEISLICKTHNLYLIEDCAWGCGGKLDDKFLGSWGDIGTFSFDFAKTMTTGEGGMLIFKDKAVHKLAAAWHDHGHENNPSVPRWEDTRSGSGFNYRMMELQGAIGLAQLRKLSLVIEAQRSNRAKILDSIIDLSGIEFREVPLNSYETADALIFMVDSNAKAMKCRNELLLAGISTKILPEAYTWHFAGAWNHMPELVLSHGRELQKAFHSSHSILSRAVSLPIGVKLDPMAPKIIRAALEKALN
jgi:8-amino-3,8-dideoxy-alpha-D-manno-octulosonate transaminase